MTHGGGNDDDECDLNRDGRMVAGEDDSMMGSWSAPDTTR